MSKDYVFKKPSRDVHSVFLHCSASDHAHHDNVKTMKNWHLQRGFSDVGYHYFIRKDGTLEIGRPIEKIPAAQSGHNSGPIAICCHGLEKAKFTAQQFKQVKKLCHQIQDAYPNKKLRFRGHTEVSDKSCPVYDYKSVLNLDENGYIKPSALAKTEACPIPKQQQTEPWALLSMLSTSKFVQDLQACLDTLYSNLKLDGVFGQETRLVLESAQKKCGVVSNGECDLISLEKLVSCRRGDTGDKVKRIQTLLSKAGYGIVVDGHFGPNTEGVVKHFQKNNQLVADGIVGPKTIKRFSDLRLKFRA